MYVVEIKLYNEVHGIESHIHTITDSFDSFGTQLFTNCFTFSIIVATVHTYVHI